MKLFYIHQIYICRIKPSHTLYSQHTPNKHLKYSFIINATQQTHYLESLIQATKSALYRFGRIPWANSGKANIQKNTTIHIYRLMYLSTLYLWFRTTLIRIQFQLKKCNPHITFKVFYFNNRPPEAQMCLWTAYKLTLTQTYKHHSQTHHHKQLKKKKTLPTQNIPTQKIYRNKRSIKRKCWAKW